jgi:hypothetical protein
MATTIGKPSDKADRPESHRPFGLQQNAEDLIRGSLL